LRAVFEPGIAAREAQKLIVAGLLEILKPVYKTEGV